MRQVHILGVGATSFSRGGRSGEGLVREATAAALADAGLRPGEIEAVTVATGRDRGADPALEGFDGLPLPPHPPVCVSGAAALHLCWRAVAFGVHDVMLCAGSDVAGGPGPKKRIDALASAAERYMHASGATEEHLARVAAKNRTHGAENPRALLTTRVDTATVLGSDLLAAPLRSLMVAQRSAGAAAVVLAAGDPGRRHGARPPRVRASILIARGAPVAASARAARLAYELAEAGPEEVDVAEIDGPSAAGELMAYEALQFALDGEGPELVDSGFTALGGVLPVNTSGGALAQGEAVGTAAIAQVCELAWQLRGEAGRRQVPGARLGLALACGHAADGAAVSLTMLGTG